MIQTRVPKVLAGMSLVLAFSLVSSGMARGEEHPPAAPAHEEPTHASPAHADEKPKIAPVKTAKGHGKDSKGHAAGEKHEVHWSYQADTGPRLWGKLKPEYQVCGLGKQQSPVDIQNTLAGKPEPIQFLYRATAAEVVNNGHTIQVNLAPGSAIRVGGMKYELLQFHFHTPSEHALRGRLYDLEVHLVHKSGDGKLAVVGVFIEKGQAHEWIEWVWRSIPKEVGTPVPLGPVLFNPYNLLPEDKDYYAYPGSLTTPPCSEGVAWNVMKNSITFSTEQIKLFQAFYELNSRPVQPLLGRKIITH